ncbi:MAG: class I SAM-dependent methyltransferase [Planctomycetota bacterium]
MNAPALEKFRDPSLVDFGSAGTGLGRRLELLGKVLVDRPLQHTGLPRRTSPLWSAAAAIFQADAGRSGEWKFTAPLPDPWRVAVPLTTATLSLEVRPAPSGQIGVFLEQREQWTWLAGAARPGMTLLSLFAHSGAATLALAAAGATVVHVDASRPAIAMARRNAAASGLATTPIRWVCEDAQVFITRELRRGTRYDGVVLDPPSWGHGPKGQAFSIDRDLLPLLTDLAKLTATPTANSPTFTGNSGPILLTCHSPGWHHQRLCETLSLMFPRRRIEAGPLTCTDAVGRTIDLGDFARLPPI